MIELALRSVRFHRLLKRVGRPWRRHAERKAIGRYSEYAGRLLEHLADDGLDVGGAVPRITHAVRTRSDVVVMLLDCAGARQPAQILKLPLTPAAEQSTAAHRQVVMALHQIPALERFCALVPRSLTWGEYERQTYYIETALPGIGAGDLLREKCEPATLMPEAVRAILDLHSATAQRQSVDERAFARLAGDDLGRLRGRAPHWPEATLLLSRLDALEELLRSSLVGCELPFAWAHGDYWPGNILVRPANGLLSGIIDWDRASAQQLPVLDILHLLAYTRKMRRRTALGEEIVSYLLPAAFSLEERALLDETFECLRLPQDAAFVRSVVLLYWLRFAAANLARYPRYEHDREWMRDNVYLVLKRGLS
jgi:aminoglycoside phosphotransferase (APT) family kinase protein